MKNKNINVILIVLGIVIIVVVGILIYGKIQSTGISSFEIVITDKECEEELKQIYEDKTTIYYIKCTNEINVKYPNGKEEELSKALKNKNITIEKLKEKDIEIIIAKK